MPTVHSNIVKKHQKGKPKAQEINGEDQAKMDELAAGEKSFQVCVRERDLDKRQKKVLIKKRLSRSDGAKWQHQEEEDGAKLVVKWLQIARDLDYLYVHERQHGFVQNYVKNHDQCPFWLTSTSGR